MRDKLSKSLGVDKALLAEQDDITIAKLYCLQYVADQTAYSAFLKGINKKDLTVNMHSRGTLNINIYLDEQIYSGEYLAEKEITRRFKDENRTGYLDNKSDLLLADALKTQKAIFKEMNKLGPDKIKEMSEKFVDIQQDGSIAGLKEKNVGDTPYVEYKKYESIDPLEALRQKYNERDWQNYVGNHSSNSLGQNIG